MSGGARGQTEVQILFMLCVLQSLLGEGGSGLIVRCTHLIVCCLIGVLGMWWRIPRLLCITLALPNLVGLVILLNNQSKVFLY